MSDKLTRFSQALKKYKLTEPAKPETKATLSRYKKDDLTFILKKTGSYSILFGLITSVYFFFKKIGFGISIAQSTIIVAIGSVTVIASVSTGTYYTVKHAILPRLDKKNPSGIKDPQNTIIRKDPSVPGKQLSPVVIISEYGLVPLTADNAPPELAQKATAALYAAIKQAYTLTGITIISTQKQSAVNKMIIGSIEKIDNSYSISVRLVQVNNAKILKIASETVDSEHKISAACKKIARKIIE